MHPIDLIGYFYSLVDLLFLKGSIEIPHLTTKSFLCIISAFWQVTDIFCIIYWHFKAWFLSVHQLMKPQKIFQLKRWFDEVPAAD